MVLVSAGEVKAGAITPDGRPGEGNVAAGGQGQSVMNIDPI